MNIDIFKSINQDPQQPGVWERGPKASANGVKKVQVGEAFEEIVHCATIHITHYIFCTIFPFLAHYCVIQFYTLLFVFLIEI